MTEPHYCQYLPEVTDQQHCNTAERLVDVQNVTQHLVESVEQMTVAHGRLVPDDQLCLPQQVRSRTAGRDVARWMSHAPESVT